MAGDRLCPAQTGPPQGARVRDHAQRGGSNEPAAAGPDADALARLGDALDQLAQASVELAELVDLHFFCGFSLGEIAGLRGVSERTVQRDWRKARLVLHQLVRDADLPSA